jgi:hypothetical protein
MLNLTTREFAIFRRLALEGSAKSEGAAELLDRGWVVYVDDRGTVALSADGIQIAQMVGLDRDGGDAAGNASSSRA